MALPKITQTGTDHTITLDDDLTVTFHLTPIPGKTYQAILDDHRDDDGKVTHDDVAVEMLDAGIATVYSSVESTPQPFTADDATEIWETWPDWARMNVYQAVVTYSTRGPAADPFDASARRKTAEG